MSGRPATLAPMAWLALSNLHLAFGHVALLDGADFSLEPRERVALIGRNGAGKSSLLRIVAGRMQPDDGLVQRQAGIAIAFVDQEPVFDAEHSIRQAVAGGLAIEQSLLAEYDRLVAMPDHDEAELTRLHEQLDARDAWSLDTRINTVLSRLALNGDLAIAALSGGQRKRVALARALVAQPDVLILDEPTNHLDLDAIAWLEDLLLDFKGSVLLVTHDRRFLDRVATRVVELDRGKLRSYPGNFSAYQTRKAEQLAIEAVENAKFDKFLAQEEVWIRKGVEARRTRNEGRVLRLMQLRRDREARRERVGQVNLQIDTGGRSGKIVAELQDVYKSYRRADGSLMRVIDGFTGTLMRGDKIGLIGPNGAGKTTLLKLILGELEPDSGTVRRGSNLQVAYFDQLRAQLAETVTVQDTISPGSDWVEINGERKHVMSYLGDFLFAPERARSPVASLSGGERNRLLLARLFARPANVLVLDEPTNDLDIETLELLEDLLQSYPGTVFLVSHDRAFLDNVVTQTIAYEGEGRWREYAGGYEDWKLQSARSRAAQAAVSESAAPRAEAAAAAVMPAAVPAASAKQAAPSGAKLSYKEKRELEELPARIEALEAEQQVLAARMAEPDFYKSDAAEIRSVNERVAAIEVALLQALERWSALEGRPG
jgi:ATP-binding cassette subfamily F protein uup